MNLGHALVFAILFGILLTLCGCQPQELPPEDRDNVRCRCEGFDEFFIRGQLRSSVKLRGGNVVVMGDVDCTLRCEVDPIEAEEAN